MIGWKERRRKGKRKTLATSRGDVGPRWSTTGAVPTPFDDLEYHKTEGEQDAPLTIHCSVTCRVRSVSSTTELPPTSASAKPPIGWPAASADSTPTSSAIKGLYYPEAATSAGVPTGPSTAEATSTQTLIRRYFLVLGWPLRKRHRL